MRKKLRKFLLLISLVLFLSSAYQATTYWDYKETLVDLNQSVRKTVTKKTILTEIQLSIDKAEFDNARMYLAIAKSSYFNTFSNQDKDYDDFLKIEREIEQKDTTLRRLITQANHFSSGFIKGRSTSTAGVAGSVVADFTVVGDIRDLAKEYKKHQQGENINELIVLLSGAGMGLTALTLSTRGVAAPAKAGTSIIKAAVKAQRITRRFQKYLVKLGRDAFDWKLFSRLIKNNKNIPNIRKAAKQAYHPEAMQPLNVIIRRVNSIRRSTSTIDTIHLLKYIDTPKDLIQLEKVSLKYGAKTKGYMKLLGKGALRSIRVLQKTTKLLLSLLSSFFSGLLSIILIFTRKILV